MKNSISLKVAILLLFQTVFFNELYSVTIWSEDFESYADDATAAVDNNTANPAVDWTLSNNAFADYFRVEDNDWTTPLNGNRSFVGWDTDDDATWTTEAIDISAYTNVGISILIGESGWAGNQMEGSDWIDVDYRIDGGAWTQVPGGYITNDFADITVTETGLSGGTIEIRVRMYNNHNYEVHQLDDVVVTGDLAGSSCNPCYSIASGNFNAASTWSDASGGAAVAVAPANNGTVSFIIEGGYTVNMNADFSIDSLTLGASGNGYLEWTAGNVQLDVNGGGVITIASGSYLDENGQTNADIVFNDGSFTYSIVNSDNLNGLDIDNIYVEDDVTLNILGSGLMDVDNNIYFIGSDSRINNSLTGTFTVRNDIQWGDADTDGNNRFDNDQTMAILGDVYFLLQTDDDTLYNNGTMNITGDVIWPDDGMTGAAANVDGYVENNGTMTIGDDLYFGADDCKFINNGILNITDDIFYFEHTDLTGITNNATFTVTVGGEVTFQQDANASTSNWLTNDGDFDITGSVTSDQGNITITNLSNGTLDIGGDILQDHSSGDMTVSNDGVMTVGDDLRLWDSNSGMDVTNAGTLSFNEVEASNGDLDITNTGTITQSGAFLSGEIDGSSEFINGANARWNYGGTGHDTDTDMDCSATGNTFNYNRVGDQDLIDVTTNDYHHLEVTVSGTKSSVDDIDIEGNLLISGTATFDVDAGNDDITIAGNWTNTSSGGFTEGTESVTFDGTTDQTIICSTIGTETFHDLNINKNAADMVVLNNNAAINSGGVLNFSGTNAYLQLNSNDFTVTDWTAGDITGYDTDEFILADATGYVRYTGVDAAEVVEIPIGLAKGATNYALAELTMTDPGAGNLDANMCGHVQADGLLCTAVADITSDIVNYTWNFESTSTDAEVKLYWDNSKELASFDRMLSSVSHHGGVSWGPLSGFGPAVSEGGSLYSRTGTTTSFSRFSVGGGTALPVTLLSFSAKMAEDIVYIEWSTASEVNNDYFTVERSSDGVHFEELGIVFGAGNSNNVIEYAMQDTDPFEGVSYYRLKQTDYDGTISYSDNKVVSRTEVIGATVFPNPVKENRFYLSMQGELDEDVLVVLYSTMGEEVYSKVIVHQEGNSMVAFDLSGKVKPGVYFVVGSSKDELFRHQLIVR